MQVGLPWWFSGKESACQYRRRGFDPWVRNIPWRRKQQPTPVFLPGKSHGLRSLVGHCPRGCKRVGHDLATRQRQQSIQVAGLDDLESIFCASETPSKTNVLRD